MPGDSAADPIVHEVDFPRREATMPIFSNLETAALQSIFDEAPEIASELRRQIAVASVIKRENTGGGFITTIAVPDVAPHAGELRVLGSQTAARVDGLVHGLGFALMIKDGRLHALDGHSQGGENTTDIDFEQTNFSIYRPVLPD